MGHAPAHLVAAVGEFIEHLVDIGMVDRAAGPIADKVLLADIGHVVRIVTLGEEVVVRLIALGANLFAKVGSMSNTTPRKSNILWRTTSPTPKRAWRLNGTSIWRPAWWEKNCESGIRDKIDVRGARHNGQRCAGRESGFIQVRSKRGLAAPAH